MSRLHATRHRALLSLFVTASSLAVAAAAFAGKPAADLPLYAANDPVDAPELIPQVDPGPAPLAPPPAPASTVTLALIKELVDAGTLPKEKAAGLLKLAEAEAEQIRVAQDVAVQNAVAQTLAAVRANPELAGLSVPRPPDPNAVRITYIPEVVKNQVRDEIKRDLATQARNEQWGRGPKLPDWAERFRFFADVRLRGESINFSGANDNTGAFPNFNAINTGAPFDTSGTVFSPQLNADQDRERARLRVRFGVESDLGDGFSAGLRLATGSTNAPTSTNQDLGGAGNGQGGNFSKYAIWLDRAFLKWETGTEANGQLAVSLGRFDNPFFSTEAIFDDDVGFDGVAVQVKRRFGKGFTPFLTAGAFPVFNTDLNFASNQPAKFDSTDKWLYAAQAGVDWRITDKMNLKVAAAYYNFADIEGQLSDPFVPLSASDAGNTDGTRPAFAQKGNTYRPLRNIIPTAENDFGTSRQFQYYGLATPFRNLAITGKLDFNYWEPVQISLYGEYLKNLAFDRNAIDAIAVNNRGSSSTGIGAYDGGDTAWLLGLKVGKPALEKRGDWLLGVNYRHIESDAVVDGFNDSDFGLGGTNMQGFTLWGAYALSPRVNVGLRWMSADEIAGPPLSTDIFQIDFNAKF